MSPEELARLKKLARQYGITFHRLDDSSERPLQYADLFDSINTLGRVTAQNYQPVTSNAYAEPWKRQTLRRARRLSELACRCESEGRNEQSWRLHVEPEILSRFTIEVACPRCRQRIWRSEIEVFLNDQRALDSLEQRRQNRAACTCDPLTIGDQSFDHGVNPLFSDRAGETIHHESQLAAKLHKGEQPDRIYGLQSTKVFHKLLDRLEEQSVVGNDSRFIPRVSPFSESANDLLFPFLVLEAKSAKSGDDFQHIQAQSAFSIRTLLQIQEELANINGPTNVSTYPLVWFLCSRGDVWKVFAACVEASDVNRSYKVFELWQGSIISLDNALQLLLIVDHIFDWARDAYRPAVIETLKVRTQANTASLEETDFYSVAEGPIDAWLHDGYNNQSVQSEDPEDQEDEVKAPLSYQKWEKPEMRLGPNPGTVREMSRIRSQFCGLYLTTNNIDDFLKTYNTPGLSKTFARSLLKLMQVNPCLVDSEGIHIMERIWTSQIHEADYAIEDHDQMYAVFNFCAYFSPKWEIIRELAFVAISKPAVDTLVKISGLKKPPKLENLSPPFMSGPLLESFSVAMRYTPVPLTAPVSRASISSAWVKAPPQSGSLSTVMWTRTSLGMYGFRDVNATIDVHAFLAPVFSKHKLGRRQARESYLRLSSLVESEDPPGFDEPTLWPTAKAWSMNENGTVLIQNYGKAVVENCLFLVSESSKQIDLSNVENVCGTIYESATEGPVYETRTRDLFSGRRTKLNFTVRNRSDHPDIIKFWVHSITTWINYFQANERPVDQYAANALDGLSRTLKSGVIWFNGKRVRMDRYGLKKSHRGMFTSVSPWNFLCNTPHYHITSFRNDRAFSCHRVSTINTEQSVVDPTSSRPRKRARLSSEPVLITAGACHAAEESSLDHPPTAGLGDEPETVQMAPWDPSPDGFERTRPPLKPVLGPIASEEDTRSRSRDRPPRK